MRYSAGMRRFGPGPVVLACVVVLAAAMPRVLAQRPQLPVVVERVEVARLLIDVRVVDDHGRARRGLQREDFDVEIGGKRAAVESVQWVGGSAPVVALATAATDSAIAVASPAASDAAPPGRLIVFLVQKSMAGHRVAGLLRMLDQSGTLLAHLQPSDRAAVLSFDSHLTIWLDFTSDVARVRTTLSRVMLERPPPVRPAGEPSLAARLDPERARRTFRIEEALLQLGEALEPLPGAKSVILIGYGFGQLGLGWDVHMEHDYEDAAYALQRARATFFCLDVTNADYHSLELGLQNVAADTGGFFGRTHEFAQRALDYVAQALAGHYVLLVEKPALDQGSHPLKVRLSRRGGPAATVLSRTTYTQ